MDPVTLEVLRHSMDGVADEMGAVLRRTAISPNIKEREDCSAAVFSPDGELAAQAEHVPVHLGSMPASVAAALEAFDDLEPGDQVLLNDPFQGGTHLNDLTLVAPVHSGGRLLGYVANRAHHTDVGGATAGSMPVGAVDVYAEGVRIPPIRLVRAGTLDDAVVRLVRANSRTPDEREGDLLAQVGANARGAERLRELGQAHGTDGLAGGMRALTDYAEARVVDALSELDDGTWTFTDLLDDDGAGNGPIRIECALTLSRGEMVVDLSGSDPQTPGGVNTVRAVTVSAAAFVLRCLVPPDVPTNAGCFRPLTVVTRPGTVVDARAPAAVGAGNVECSQRICDAIWGAFAVAVPGRAAAASQGTMNNLLIGGSDDEGRPFTYYETVAGGAGAGPWGPGASGVHTNMTNTRNTPVEALEHSYPLRVVVSELREGSGGPGRHRGGDGNVREIEVLAPSARVTLVTERRVHAPWGADGGSPGRVGRNTVDGEPVPGKVSLSVGRGTRVRLETPGGGGWGTP